VRRQIFSDAVIWVRIRFYPRFSTMEEFDFLSSRIGDQLKLVVNVGFQSKMKFLHYATGDP